MPKGIPKAGFRRRRGKSDMSILPNRAVHIQRMVPVENDIVPVRHESDELIAMRLANRFEIMDAMIRDATNGTARAVIVSGPPGLGKSYTIEHHLQKWNPANDKFLITRGYVRPTGLFKLLYQYRSPGQVIVFDDADSIFSDDTSLNFLKAVCDTTKKRIVSYLAETVLIDEDSATRIPRQFEFEGTIIFITNYDFDALISRGHKLTPHLEALMSRSHYIDLALKNRRDYFVRIKTVFTEKMLAESEFRSVDRDVLLDFIEDNLAELREVSLRMAIKIAALCQNHPITWKRIAKITCCKEFTA